MVAPTSARQRKGLPTKRLLRKGLLLVIVMIFSTRGFMWLIGQDDGRMEEGSINSFRLYDASAFQDTKINKAKEQTFPSNLASHTTSSIQTIHEDNLHPKMFTVEQTNFTIDVFDTMPACTIPLTPDEVSFTLTIQLSIDRLWIMKHQCEAWPAPLPISLVVYLPPTAQSTDESIVIDRLDKECHCDLSRIRLVLFRATPNSPIQSYPVNVLRNLALKNILTTHAVYTDSDFLISMGLHHYLVSTARQVLSEDPKAAVVIPAFDYISACSRKYDSQAKILACLQAEWSMVPRQYEDVLSLLDKKDLPHVDRGFQSIHGKNPYHGTTLYRTWGKNQSSIVRIPCIVGHTYEPYLALRVCQDLPIFPEGFKGWGHNKVTWVKILLKKTGYRLWQLPKGFVVHIPHEISPSKKKNVDGRLPEFDGFLHWLKHIPAHPECLPLCYHWKREHGERDP